MRAFVLVMTFVGLSVAQYCPPPEVMSPCSCTPALTIHCVNIRQQFNLKEIFDNAAQYVDVRTYYTSLTIADTSLVEIEDGAIDQFRFGFVNISGNPNLEYISPRAFGAGRNDTLELTLSRNKLRDDSIFDTINGFKNLRQVRLDGNNITSIPEHAFQNMPSLERVYLDSNAISHIGSQAFVTGAENLISVDLYDNAIPSGGLAEDTFDGVNSVDFILQCNEMEFMEQRSFQTLLDSARSVFIGGNSCPGEDNNSPRRLICDERADWICDQEDVYRPKLRGFLCKLESGFENLWVYCAARNN